MLNMLKPVLAVLLLCVASGCGHARPRSANDQATRATGWDEERCDKARTKKDAMTGVTAGLGVLAGGSGLGTVFPDDKNGRLALGISSLTVGIATAIMAPFTTSATKTYADHCEDK